MGTLTQDKDGNDRAKPLGITADPARAVPTDALAATGPDDTAARQQSSKPVRAARRPPAIPIPMNSAESSARSVPSAPGFFHIRKKGQGYWTRMGTAAGAALIGAMTIQFIYSERDTFHLGDGGAELTCAIFALVYGFGIYYFMNRPTSVDFLIATDSEMKKVNWTTRKELLGSTKVIILFMFVIAAYLFVMDIFFGYLFWAIGVLKEPPL